MGLNIIKDFFGKMFSLQYTEYSIANAYIMLEKIKSYIKNLVDTFLFSKKGTFPKKVLSSSDS